MREVLTLPIRVGFVTLAGYIRQGSPPFRSGNCFSLCDESGISHRVVNFHHENLIEWMKVSGQKDIRVRCIEKSDSIWEVCDERIPKEWYNSEYCTTCTPLRMLPRQQRLNYLSKYKFKKFGKVTMITTISQ